MRMIQRLVWFISGLVLLASSTVYAQPAQVEKKYPNEVYYDFRGKPLPDELALTPIGSEQFVTSEPEGLRITLPKDRKDLAQLVVGTRSGIKGDFEITATLEILRAEAPKSDFGVGASLYINKADSDTEGATLGRIVKPSGEQQIFWDQGFGKNQYDIGTRPYKETQVRLRMKRTGAQLAYFVGKGLKGDHFDELPPKEFGGNDIKQVIVRVTTGRQRADVDVRLVDLRIRSGAAPATTIAVVPATAPPSRNWLLAALCVAVSILTLAVAVLSAMLLRRQKRAGST